LALVPLLLARGSVNSGDSVNGELRVMAQVAAEIFEHLSREFQFFGRVFSQVGSMTIVVSLVDMLTDDRMVLQCLLDHFP